MVADEHGIDCEAFLQACEQCLIGPSTGPTRDGSVLGPGNPYELLFSPAILASQMGLEQLTCAVAALRAVQLKRFKAGGGTLGRLKKLLSTEDGSASPQTMQRLVELEIADRGLAACRKDVKRSATVALVWLTRHGLFLLALLAELASQTPAQPPREEAGATTTQADRGRTTGECVSAAYGCDGGGGLRQHHGWLTRKVFGAALGSAVVRRPALLVNFGVGSHHPMGQSGSDGGGGRESECGGSTLAGGEEAEADAEAGAEAEGAGGDWAAARFGRQVVAFDGVLRPLLLEMVSFLEGVGADFADLTV